ncbi:hypothetical protein ACJJTC_014036 [Scirpophaga incertulas]
MSDKGTPNCGSIKEFKVHVDRWSTYMSRLKAWFTIHDIKLASQSKYLVAVNTWWKIICHRGRSVIAERMIFRSFKQIEGQSISDYLVGLKKLSKACKFSNNVALKENLRDQFVYGPP